jgi:hypothetical protein
MLGKNIAGIAGGIFFPCMILRGANPRMMERLNGLSKCRELRT